MIPKVPEVLARTMIEEGMAVPDGEEPLFAIYPEILGDAKKPVRLSVLKIRNVERLVIEQHKLYSIKEHESKRKTAPVIEVPPEDLDIPEITPSTTHQKRFESSLDTVGRVLGNITLAQRETWEEETAVQPPHQEERSPGDIAPIDEAMCKLNLSKWTSLILIARQLVSSKRLLILKCRTAQF
ncbi:hypothetical protein JCM19236_6366 [Vibrio sp. JCM 19236]|nr:hypothetical protein JCM19236_6366 [Vibrio sp. JCM 19236]